MNLPKGSVGLLMDAKSVRDSAATGGSSSLLTKPGAGRYGLMASWNVASIPAGRIDEEWKAGFTLRISASAVSVSPLTRAKMGVKRPGCREAPRALT